MAGSGTRSGARWGTTKQARSDRPRARPAMSPSAMRCRRKFLRFFPGGFADETYVDWERGSRRGTVALRGRSLPFQLRRSTSWSIYRAWVAGDVVVGPMQATRLTFWEPGTSGKQEMIGVRGQSRFDVRSTPTVESVIRRGETARP